MTSALIASALLALAFIAPAHAHDWYPHECCSNRDCWPMGADADAREPEPAIVPGGYRTRDGVFVAERDARPSRDGRFHICRRAGMADGEMISPTGRPACLFVPKPTF